MDATEEFGRNQPSNFREEVSKCSNVLKKV